MLFREKIFRGLDDDPELVGLPLPASDRWEYGDSVPIR